MNRFSCKTIVSRFSDYERGLLSQEVTAAARIHLASCPECRQAYRVWKGVRCAVREMPVGESTADAQSRVTAIDMPRLEYRIRRGIRSKQLIKGGAVGLVLFFGLFVLANAFQHVSDVKMEQTSSYGYRSDEIVSRPYCPPEYRVENGRRMVEIDVGTALYIDDDAIVAVKEAGPEGIRFYLSKGTVIAEIGPSPLSYRFVVETPSGEVEARGTVFSVTVPENRPSVVRVSQGTVSVTIRNGRDTTALDAGSQLEFSMDGLRRISSISEEVSAPEAAEVSRPSDSIASLSHHGESTKRLPVVHRTTEITRAMREGRLDRAAVLLRTEEQRDPHGRKTRSLLVELAQAYRLARRYDESAAVYQKLIRRFPGTATAQNSLFSLGELALNTLNRPSLAEAHFNDYLEQAPNGMLAEQARSGLVRARYKKRNWRTVVQAADAYVAHHPKGRFIRRVLRYRVTALSAMNQCDAAKRDLERLEERWPDAEDTRQAVAVMKKCETSP